MPERSITEIDIANFLQNARPDVRAQCILCDQIDAALECLFQGFANRVEIIKRSCLRRKSDQHVHVAVSPHISPGDRTEYAQPLHARRDEAGLYGSDDGFKHGSNVV